MQNGPSFHTLRVFSHLARLFWNLAHFFSLVRLDGNRAWIGTIIFSLRSPERGGPGPNCKLILERCAYGEKAIRPNGPMNQVLSLYMMGNYIDCMKSSSACFANALHISELSKTDKNTDKALILAKKKKILIS